MEFIGDLVGDLLGWLGDLLPGLGEGLAQKHTGDALAEGRVDCALKVISGRQRGLSARWRTGVAAVSPGRLDFTREGWPFSVTGPVAIPYLAVIGPGRPPSTEELARLPGDCRIAELQAPTATLGWAVPARHLPWALEHLQHQPADGSPAP